jgi:hypothetical protein
VAFFKSTSGASVACYGGTHCSGTILAEITDAYFIAKARANPEFAEVEVIDIEPEVVKPRRKKVTKKRPK